MHVIAARSCGCLQWLESYSRFKVMMVTSSMSLYNRAYEHTIWNLTSPMSLSFLGVGCLSCCFISCSFVLCTAGPLWIFPAWVGFPAICVSTVLSRFEILNFILNYLPNCAKRVRKSCICSKGSRTSDFFWRMLNLWGIEIQWCRFLLEWTNELQMNQLESHKLEKKAQIEMTSYGKVSCRRDVVEVATAMHLC